MLSSFLAVAACISYPEVTTYREPTDASVSPDGSSAKISLVEELSNGGDVPHPDENGGAAVADASVDEPADVPPGVPEEDGRDAGGKGPPKGKGKGKSK